MLKSLVVIAALAIAAPNLAFAQQKPNNPAAADPQQAPGGPSNLTVTPPGLDHNPNGIPNMPAVFTAAGQPTGGSPAGGPNVTRGEAHFHSP